MCKNKYDINLSKQSGPYNYATEIIRELLPGGFIEEHDGALYMQKQFISYASFSPHKRRLFRANI